jgi:hypothetical protein
MRPPSILIVPVVRVAQFAGAQMQRLPSLLVLTRGAPARVSVLPCVSARVCAAARGSGQRQRGQSRVPQNGRG